MKRNFVVSLFGSLVGFGMLFILLSAAGIVGARSADIPRHQARPDSVSATTPLTSTFTYQGQLKNGGNAVNGSCDMAFRLYDDPGGGNLIGSPITATVPVANGLFTVGLNFVSSAFDVTGRWLDIKVNCGSGFTQLTPRQALTPAPYALAFGAPGSVYGYLVSSGSLGPYYPTIGFNTYGSSYLAGVAGYGGIFQFQDGDGKLIYYTGSNVAADSAHANTARVAINSNGNVGIGTTAPSALLSVVKSGAPEPNVQGVETGLKVGTPAGTIPLALKQNVANSTTPTLAYFETGDGDLGYLSASPSTFVMGSTAGKGMALKVDGSTTAMTINSFGNVGIGTSNPLATLDVNGGIRGNSLTAPADLFVNATGRIALRTSPGGLYGERMTILANGNVGIFNTNPAARLHVSGTGVATALAVYDNGLVQIGGLSGSSTTHACFNNGGFFAGCSSAAEYVPSIDSGFGFPETTDLVSIAPAIKNPYEDEHSPFVVTKSAQPCDANLLGFIVNPESGADGKKLNDHYLPLAIYGYFPAKVTMENGAIKRGDPLTSSSKAGYGMKATQACKIIGYALEDADHEGTIQVFANHGENAASEVVVLRTQVQELKQTVAELKQENAALDARLTALEQATSGRTPTQSATPRDVLLFGAMFAIVGIVVGRRVDKRGSQ